MTSNASQRLSRAERMNRIAEAFRRSAKPAGSKLDPARRQESSAPADTRVAPPADTDRLGKPDAARRLEEALRDRNEGTNRASPGFSHLHRRLAKGEPIPQAPGLLEQVLGLSRLLAQRPLWQQEEDALRGDEDLNHPGGQSGQTAAGTGTEDEASA
jgi:hypothetical protein